MIGFQLQADELRVQALHDRQDPLQHHLFSVNLFLNARPQFARSGEENYIRQPDTVNSGHERNRDPAPTSSMLARFFIT